MSTERPPNVCRSPVDNVGDCEILELWEITTPRYSTEDFSHLHSPVLGTGCAAEEFSDYPVVFLQSFCEDEDVIQVYHYYTFRNEIFEYNVHYGLEGSWTIGQAKEHN